MFDHALTLIASWNAFAELGVFATVSLLLATLRTRMQHAETLALSDPLTGLANRRALIAALSWERERTSRTGLPFTLAYRDLDGFEQLNDRPGHAEGDHVLSVTARTLHARLRQLDLAARLGGDEFALLLPETDLAGARELIVSLHAELLTAMAAGRWGITLSVGVLTVLPGAAHVQELLSRADAVMYECKRAGKNVVRFAELGGELVEEAQ